MLLTLFISEETGYDVSCAISCLVLLFTRVLCGTIKDRGHSAKSAGGRLQLDMFISYTLLYVALCDLMPSSVV